jgi:urea transport system ATP-binding protein
MTPDLMDEGARRAAAHAAMAAQGRTASGGRSAGFARPVAPATWTSRTAASCTSKT